jgi:hypothetical protein
MPSLSNRKATAQARGIQRKQRHVGIWRGIQAGEKSDDFSNFMLHYADYDYPV